MPRKRPICVDCGKKLDNPPVGASCYQGRCPACRENYGSCIRCGEIRLLADMRQTYCVDCRREYDRDRWARQRAARGVR